MELPIDVPLKSFTSEPQSGAAVHERFLGCMLGGGVGDALGEAVEFLSRAEILRRFGPSGITDYASAHGEKGGKGGKGRITDDTQMTLFTAEGLLRGWVRGLEKDISSYKGTVAHAYLRWLATQGYGSPLVAEQSHDGWLYSQAELHQQRAPGMTCLSALRDMTTLGEAAVNDSKGCGGVMRVAPAGLFCWNPGDPLALRAAFDLGADLAGLTHGHPTGSLSGGVLAALIFSLADGVSLSEALTHARALLTQKPHHQETLKALGRAVLLSKQGKPHSEAIEQLGEGWIAEEALAIAVYCALVAESFEEGVLLAVNHSGDSDSTGAIAGNLLGTLYGARSIPRHWLDGLELRGVIAEVADDLWACREWKPGQSVQLGKKYPGW